MQTKQSHDRTLIILMGVGAGILLLAALGLFLVQNLDEPLPGDEAAVTASASATATQTQTLTATSTLTRRPTRTPVLLTDTLAPPTETEAPASSATPTVVQPTASLIPAASNTPTSTQAPASASATPSNTPLPATATDTLVPEATSSPTPTLSPTPLGELILVTGRVVSQGTPIANVTITLEGRSVLTTTTGADGTYQFQADWINVLTSIVFSLEANPQLSPSNNYVTWSWIEWTLLGESEVPDLEISSAPNGVVFQQTLPADGSSVSAAQITFENPVTFEWTGYPQAEQYWVDLGRQGEEEPAWSSAAVLDEYVYFDGTLDNDTKITEGSYWWAVGTLRSEPGFRFLAYTHNWTLIITP